MLNDIERMAHDLVGKVYLGSSQYPTIEAARKFIEEKYPNVSPKVITDAIEVAETWLTNERAVPGYNGMVIAAGDVIDVAIQGGLLDTMTDKQLREMLRNTYPNASDAQLKAAVDEALASRAGSITQNGNTAANDTGGELSADDIAQAYVYGVRSGEASNINSWGALEMALMAEIGLDKAEDYVARWQDIYKGSWDNFVKNIT
jgi:hypothetical protein